MNCKSHFDQTTGGMPLPSVEIRTTAILAGGKSRRFGSNKAMAPWRGRRVIDAVVGAARAVSHTVFIVANDAAAYEDLNLDIVPDSFPAAGPLAGLHAALQHAQGNRVLLLGCDMPLLNLRLLDWLWRRKTWAPALVPIGPQGPEPLHALYHVSLLPLVERRLMRLRNSGLRSFLQDIPCGEISAERLRRFCPDLLCLASANTRAELDRLARHADSCNIARRAFLE
jgi:molybdopterin-guanine dinucleotide biosynthesis protein A